MTIVKSGFSRSTVRNVALLMQGQFVTSMGSQIYDVAMLLWIKQLTGSAAVMGLAMLATGLPEVLLAPLGGRIADRFGRLRVIVVSDVASAIVVAMVLLATLSVINGSAGPLVAIAALCFGNAVLGVTSACFEPAVAALIPSLVAADNLEKGNAAVQFSRVGGRILGQGLGGLLFAMLGVAGTFALNVLSYAASALSELPIRVRDRESPQANRNPGGSLVAETRATLARVWRTPAMRALLLLIAAIHLCLSCLPILLPYFAQHILAIADAWFGLFMAVYTAGIMLGFAVAGALKPPRSRFRRIALMSGVTGAFLALLAATSSAIAATAFLLAVGLGIGVVIVSLMRRSGDREASIAIEKDAWIEILASSGMNEADMQRWHEAFERDAPDAHHSFLQWLGIPEQDVLKIRESSRA